MPAERISHRPNLCRLATPRNVYLNVETSLTYILFKL